MVATTASGTTRDKQNKSYVDSPQRGSDFTAQEVFVGNGYSDPIPVDTTTRGVSKYEYNEVSSTGLETITIINHTVGAGLGVDLSHIDCSGDNRAIYTVEINNVEFKKKRSYYTSYNVDFILDEIPITDGDNIKIKVENKTSMSAFFNATLHYKEYDL